MLSIISAKTLSNIKSGQKVTIQSYSEINFKSVLFGIGIVPGDEIEVIRESFLGSPIFFKNKSGLFFALRKNEADRIKVEFV